MIDWIAGLFELTGSWMIGNKNKYGFLTIICGCILWVVVAFRTEVYGLLIVVIPAIFIDIRNFYKWKKRPLKKGTTNWEKFQLASRKKLTHGTGKRKLFNK